MLIRVPIVGSNEVRFRIDGGGGHRVPREIVLARLAADLEIEIGRGWYACILHADGRGTMLGEDGATPPPDEGIRNLLMHLAVRLNREIHHDGHWIVGWSADRNVHAFWRDGDGDIHVSMATDVPVIDLTKWTDTDFLNLCEEAWRTAMENLRNAEIGPENTYKAALGQMPLSPLIRVH